MGCLVINASKQELLERTLAIAAFQVKYLSKFKSYPLTLNESSICGRQREKLSTILHFLRDTSSKRCCVMIKWLSKVLGKKFDRKIEKRRRKHALSSMLWWKVSLSEYYLLLHEARNSKKWEFIKFETLEWVLQTFHVCVTIYPHCSALEFFCYYTFESRQKYQVNQAATWQHLHQKLLQLT